MSNLSKSKTYNSGLINISKLAYKYNKHTKTFHKDKKSNNLYLTFNNMQMYSFLVFFARIIILCLFEYIY